MTLQTISALTGHRRAKVVFSAASQKTGLVPTTSPAAALLGYEGDVLDRRSRRQIANDPLLNNAAELLAGIVCGPVNDADDPGAPRATNDDAASSAMKTWAKSCGYRHQHGTLHQILNLAVLEAIKGKGSFVRRVQVRDMDPRLASNGLTLHVLSGRDVACGKSGTVNGRTVERGLEYDETGSRLSAIWFHDTSQTGRMTPTNDFRVDIWNLAPLRHITESDSLTSAPSFTPAIKDAIMGTRAEAAHMRASELAASTPFVALTGKSSTGKNWLTGGSTKPEITTAAGQPINSMLPGDVVLAHHVEDVKFAPQNDRRADLSNNGARIAAGTGLTRASIAGDPQGNFSTLIFIGLKELQAANRWASNFGFDQLRAKIVQWFVEAELLVARNWTQAVWAWAPRMAIDVNRANSVAAVNAMRESTPERPEPLISTATARAMLGRDPDKERDLIAQEQGRTLAPAGGDRHGLSLVR